MRYRRNIELSRRLVPGVRVLLSNGSIRQIVSRCGPRVHWKAIRTWGRPVHGNGAEGNCWDYDIAKRSVEIITKF